METEQLATIITTGDVPLSLRMTLGQDESDSNEVRIALELHRSGDYKGLTYDQVIERLRQNRQEAEEKP